MPAQTYTDETKVRLSAFFVLVLVTAYALTGYSLVTLFLVIDFALRSFDMGKFSPISVVSARIVKIFQLPVKPVYLPPKRFAARIGLAFSFTILVLHFLQVTTIIISGVLAFFAILESFFGFCAGCYAYSYLQRFRKQV